MINYSDCTLLFFNKYRAYCHVIYLYLSTHKAALLDMCQIPVSKTFLLVKDGCACCRKCGFYFMYSMARADFLRIFSNFIIYFSN